MVNKIIINYALLDDLEKILELQYIAYQSEAILVNDFKIQPLIQTLTELRAEYNTGIIYKACNEENEIVGSVRGHIKDNTLFIGKLMVQPDLRGQGIGTMLLKYIEKDNPDKRYELFTSDLSKRNIRLYEKNGYVKFKQVPTPGGFNLVYLEKGI